MTENCWHKHITTPHTQTKQDFSCSKVLHA